MVNVLVIPGGAGAIGIVDALKSKYNVVSADLDPFAPALLREDVTGYQLPPCAEENMYIRKISNIIIDEDIDVIIPGYDLDVTTISKRRQDLPDQVDYLLPTHEKIKMSDDTLKSVQLASEADVPIPETHENISEAISTGKNEFPLFVKPRESRGGRGAIRVSNKKELEYYFEKISEEWGRAIIQEYVPSSTGSMYLAGLLYDGDGELNSVFSSRSIRTNYSWGGGGVAAEPVKNTQIIEYAKSIVEEMGGWEGPINMEFLKDPREDAYKFVEINPRLWGYNYIATINGMNLPSKIVRMCMGETVQKEYSHSTDSVLLFDFDERID